MVGLQSDWTKLLPLNSVTLLSFSSCGAVPVLHLCAENHLVLVVRCCGDPDRLCCYGMMLISVAYCGIVGPLCELTLAPTASSAFYEARSSNMLRETVAPVRQPRTSH